MIRELVIPPPALDDISEAETWYEESRPGLGIEFVMAVKGALNRALKSPETFRIVRKRDGMRGVLAKRFPYKIYFVLKGDVIVVHAVAHTAREDWDWRNR
jgi:toxin ParE1/3/4